MLKYEKILLYITEKILNLFYLLKADKLDERKVFYFVHESGPAHFFFEVTYLCMIFITFILINYFHIQCFMYNGKYCWTCFSTFGKSKAPWKKKHMHLLHFTNFTITVQAKIELWWNYALWTLNVTFFYWI